MQELFLSYAHDDNLAPPGKNGHVSLFDMFLGIELRKAGLGRRVEVWRDARRMTAGNIDDQIDAGIINSDGLISLMSRSNHESNYCNNEVIFFLTRQQNDNVIIISLTPFDKLRIPEEIRENYFIPLYDVDESNNDIVRFVVGFEDIGLTIDQRYWGRLRQVVEQIRKIVDTPPENQPAVAPTYRARAYLQIATGPLKAQVAQLRRELKSLGFEVVTPEDMPPDGPGLRSAAQSADANADFAVHLIDERPFVPKGGNDTADRIQLAETATRYHSRPDFRRFIWMPPGNSSGMQFIVGPGDEVIAREFEPFVQILLDEIERRFQPLDANRTAPVAAAGIAPRPSGVILAKLPGTDSMTVTTIAKRLASRGVAIEPVEGSPGELGVLAERGEPIVLCWGTSPSSEVSLLMTALARQPERKIGLFRLAPDRFEQAAFHFPGLAFNLELHAPDDQTIDGALDALEG